MQYYLTGVFPALINPCHLHRIYDRVFFYWNPIDKKWVKKLLGIIGTSLGVEFYPKQPVLVVRSTLIDFSARLSFDYSLGINQKGAYRFIFNSLQVGSPILVHLHFTDEHEFYTGFGIFYELEFINIKARYEEAKMLYQNII